MLPVIGVTSYILTPDELARRPWIRGVPGHGGQYTACTYTRAIWLAGGLPWVLPFGDDPVMARELAGRLDGLVLAGGEDLTPGFRDAPTPPRPERTVPERDRWELVLWEAARDRGLPVLGVCRGLQVVNQWAGGTLVADIPSRFTDSPIRHRRHGIPPRRPVHAVRLEPGSQLARRTRHASIRVNSFHHQAADRPARGLRVVGRAPDGVVEALEGNLGGPFLGVQWHPEALQDGRLTHWIHPFHWVVESARGDRT